MPIAARTIGGPGGGKTTRGINLIEMLLEKVIRDPMMIGFVSFTRAARREAAARAAAKFGLKAEALEKEGWFRTLHSCAYRQLKVAEGELIVGGKEDSDWFRNEAHIDFAPQRRSSDDYFYVGGSYSDEAVSLAMWDVARNRLEPLWKVWNKAAACSPGAVPSPHSVLDTIRLYEDAKRRTGRLDFADLLMRYAGRRWTGDDKSPFEEVEPDGPVYMLPAWLHDEAQDMTALTALVFKRLIEPSTYVYLLGDDWQAIFSFGGSDGAILTGWPVAREEVLPLSYRCRSRVLSFAEKIMTRRYPARPFKAAYEGGEVDFTSTRIALSQLRPGDDALVLARTNQFAKEACDLLDDMEIPWKRIDAGAGAPAPARAAGVAALVSLERGDPVDGEGLYRLLELVPSRTKAGELWERGTKSWFDDAENRKALFPIRLSELECVGATEMCKRVIGEGKYLDFLKPEARRLAKAARRWGPAAVEKPTIRVSTIHGSKGGEADHVVLLNQIPWPVMKAIREPSEMDAERRVWYVGASRARHKLTVASGEGDPFPEL